MTFSVSDGDEASDSSDRSEMPDFVSKLKDLSDKSEQELDSLISEKVEVFDPLVSRPAAAILVGRDLGLEVVEQSERELKVENLVPEMQDVEIKGVVTRVGDVTDFGDGRVRSLEIEDDTARTQLTFWDEDVELLDRIANGDTVLLKAGYTKREVSDWQKDNYGGLPAVHFSDDSKLEVRKGEDDWQVVRRETSELDEGKDSLDV